MSLHGGSLCIDSEPGRGTTATIRFSASRVGPPVAAEGLPA
jgi:signal transduction histidine kinase